MKASHSVRDNIKEYSDALAHINCEPWAGQNEVVQEALRIRNTKGTAFFVGNGGSAAIASHMATDWLKAGKICAATFNDASSVTAFANDCGYEHVFSEPLKQAGNPGDILFAISSSGRSLSILNAVKTAVAQQMLVVTLSGFKPDNPLRKMGDINFYVPSERYGVVEMAHFAILHSILDEVAAQ